MAMRAPSSPGCGVMHMAPTSAVSRACKTSGGAAVMGREPKSSSSMPVYCASRSSMAAAMLAATERLVSSAMRATCSPGRTLRQVSTAFLAPGINSGSGWPKYICLFYQFLGNLPDAYPARNSSRVNPASLRNAHEKPLGYIFPAMYWDGKYFARQDASESDETPPGEFRHSR